MVLINEPSRWCEKSSSEDNSDEQAELGDVEDALQRFRSFKNEHSALVARKNHKFNNVKEQKQRHVRKIRALENAQINKTLSFSCCKANKCMKAFETEEIKKWRKPFWEKSQDKQRQYLLNAFALSLYYSRETHQRRFSFSVNGKAVCHNAWYKILGISHGWFYGLLRQYEEGRASGESNRCGVTWMTSRMRIAIVWLKRHVESSGDRMPHEDRICLPSCQSKNEIYKLYLSDCKNGKIDFVCKASFKQMWRQHFSKVIIPKQNKFTKCGVCTLLKHSLRNTQDVKEREKLSDKRKVHLEQQCAERNHYYANRLKAELEPEKYLSLIVDGMDQAKTNLPHVTTISKTEQSHYLKSHVTGAISHGHRRVFSFVDLLQWKHDTNLTLNVLLQIFLRIAKEKRLPPYLLLQMDNCYRECKNKYVMAFASYLVEIELFKEVYVSYLMVGHTHEDVDQFFSRISLKLRSNNVWTLPQLHNTIRSSYNPVPESCDVKVMFDISGWLKKHIVRPLKNHVYPHAFKYYLDQKDGKAKMLYKNWADDNMWENADDPDQILVSSPTGIPDLLRPRLGGSKQEVDLADLKSKVDSSSARMSDADLQWWETFLSDEGQEAEKWDEITDEERNEIALNNWPLEKLDKFSEKKKEQPKEMERQQGELKKLLEKQYRFPRIIAGKKRKTTNKPEAGSSTKKKVKSKKRGRPPKQKK
ncbi:hypothetical protein AC249_AIPGENE23463 [Exaiptasia diaphana]|nr:hypothetical protein AC249_AIPGENE23463 [Exaiptasia diaphana]